MAGLGAAIVASAVLFLVSMLYFFLQGPQLAHGALNLLPPQCRPALRSFGAKANPILARYVRGLCAIVAFVSLATWIGVGLVFRLPHPVALAVTTGFLELVPVLGPTASATLLGSVAVLHGGTPWTFLWFALFCFLLRILVDQVVGPLVLGHAVRIHPVAVILAFLAGGILLGVLGMLLAIPTVALLKLILDDYYGQWPDASE
jgi:predicted PurR-regulated permease PerM